MTIVNRVSKLFQADVHGILDQLEDPGAVVRQAVREMELVVIEDERKASVLEKRAQHLSQLRAEAANALAEFSSQVELALGSGNEELCRTLVRKRLEEENRIHEIERVSQRVSAAREELAKVLGERRTQLQALVKKMEVFIPAEGPLGTCEESEFGSSRLERRTRAVSDEDVEIAMLKLKSREGR